MATEYWVVNFRVATGYAGDLLGQAFHTSPSHNQGSNITWSPVIIDPPLPRPPYHAQCGLIGTAVIYPTPAMFTTVQVSLATPVPTPGPLELR